ncbi:MAG: preprotein translocase subunit SecA [Alphaproteobacteria bacterium]|nr:preprotein translocase subunit SecA [Alphaproteobacteria bacterium]
MLGGIARKVFGTANDRVVRGMRKTVERINALEPGVARLNDGELRARTDDFRRRLKEGTRLDDLLPEAFATVREAAKRTLGERHYDVQLIGGMVLHQGMIAEMKTGEGKTLVATLPVYLNALVGKGVHVVTVNDYLAKRDAGWMGRVYNFLGLGVGCIVHGLDDHARREQYAADVTYGTNNELGFDYLRDNMKFDLASMVHRPFQYAIVDEVDSILVDEARTPLIISGPAEQSSELYAKVDALIPSLQTGDYDIDEKARTVSLSEQGVEHMEQLLKEAGLLRGMTLYDLDNVTVVHHSTQALRAHKLFKRDTDYMVRNGKVIIIDEFTGRALEGRRYSEGLHQALEAKEKVEVQQENQTLASITFQNYFRLYPKLGGMTGTAATEAAEFSDIYKLEVVEIPTNLPMVRKDEDDEVYRTVGEKNKAIIDQIADCQQRGQPALVGTVSIEKSEMLAAELKKRNVPHNVLNARYHEQEAHIIAQAGRPGAVTIATNMAGRGTDIKLGGNLEFRIADELGDKIQGAEREAAIARIAAEIEEAKARVLAAGGLCVIGTERHESRRIDNQLRGRSGRQGDPGRSRFYLSLQDDLMRIFGSERMDGMLKRLGLEEGEAIIHPWINKAIEKAQQKVEARNFEIRKNLLRFDDVMNDQRKVIYEQRIDLMRASDVAETVKDMRSQTITQLIQRYIPENAYSEQWQTEELQSEVQRLFGLDLPIVDWGKEEGIADQEIRERVSDAVDRKAAEKVARYTPELWRVVEKSVLLNLLDQHWKDHLLGLDHLRQGIGLRAYGQKDPLNEYKREAFVLFNNMLNSLREGVTGYLANLEIQTQQPEPPRPALTGTQAIHADPTTGENEMDEPLAAGVLMVRRRAGDIDPNRPETWGRVGRNQPCPCGSGKKYKQCHGRMA